MNNEGIRETRVDAQVWDEHQDEKDWKEQFGVRKISFQTQTLRCVLGVWVDSI